MEVCLKGTMSDDIHWTLSNSRIYAEDDHHRLVPAIRCPSHIVSECPNGVICAETGNPHYGLLNFDNILWAWLTIFQVISMEGWTDVMYHLQDAVGQGSWMYFCLIIIVGSMFAINLALAVLYLQFTTTDAPIDSCSSDSSVHEMPLESCPDVPVTSKSRWLYWLNGIQQSTWMEGITMTAIVINVGIMAADHYGMPPWQTSLSEIVNSVVAVYFLLETGIKVIGLGWQAYITDRMNVFDGVIAIAGMVEFVMSSLWSASGIGGSLYVLRIFRLLRIFKLSRSWKELNKIINTVHGSITSMANLCLIFFLFIIVMALLGMQLFGWSMLFCNVPEARPLCRPNTPCSSHPDCYLPCRSEDTHRWIDVYDAPYHQMAYCEDFTEDLDGHRYWAQVGQSIIPRHNFDGFFHSFLTVFQILTGENWNEVMIDLMRSTSRTACIYCILIIIVGNYILLNLFLAVLLDNFAGLEQQEMLIPSSTTSIQDMESEHSLTEIPTSDSSKETDSSIKDIHLDCPEPPINADISNASLTGSSLFFFTPEHVFRRFLNRILLHPVFDRIIIGIIIWSSVMLAMESPNLNPDGNLAKTISMSDRLFVLLFGLEAAVKIIVTGFVFNGPGSYLRDGWNVLDFLILAVGIALQFQSGRRLKSLRALRALRCLKPLRLVARNKGLRVVINSLFQSVPPLLNVALVCLLFFMTFAILGVSLFKAGLPSTPPSHDWISIG